ncbi:bud site selection protein [Rhodotorula kratochvilovae]
MGEYLKDVPEFIELDLGESLISRTESLASFRELGPPDLCHVIKTTGKAGQKDVGSYHYVSGVDASSSASLAAYLNSLTYTVEETASWFFGSTTAKSPWRIRGGAFCSFNAFSRVDVRVEVKIPGGVEAYVIDVRGERHEATPQMWQEVYLSAMLRAILYADDANYRLAGFRKLDPISSLDAELKFVAAAEAAFFKGWQLGSEPDIQVATVVSNHLTSGLMKYFGDSFRYGPAVNLFEKLVVKEGEVACLLAQSYLGMNEEVKAVRVLQSAIANHPQSYSLLHVQCDFLRSKGKTEWALKLAKQAVNCAPSEFVTWAKLTDVNMELGRYSDALLTLNSCPMFTYSERDQHRMPTPAKSHLPIKDFIATSGILDDEAAAHSNNDADVALLRLPAPSLRGTFAKAYVLLAKLVGVIGWDELLKCRSNVFVMEEEYRAHRAADPVPESPLAPGANGAEAGAAPHGADDVAEGFGPLAIATDDEGSEAASLKGAEDDAPAPAASSSPAAGGVPTIAVNGQTEDGRSVEPERAPSSPSIPTIKVSTESDGERERAELRRFEESEEGRRAREGVHKPGAARQAPEEKEGKDGAAEEEEDGARAAKEDEEDKDGASFQNKRLCERWLDNLFMVLYEDLRVYTIWRAEVAHFKAQHLPYRKTGTEWEILGELAQRLTHKEEAKDAFQRALDAKFSAKAWLKLLEIYADEGDVQRALNAAIRLSVYQHRWYMEAAYPTAVAHQLFKLIRRDGLAKISYSLVSMNVPQAILKRVAQPYFQYAQTFRVEGCDF